MPALLQVPVEDPKLISTPAADGIADILLQMKVITEEQLQKAQLEAISSGVPVESIVLSHNYASDKQIAKARGQQYNLEFIDLSESAVSPEALNAVPEAVARRYTAFPYSLDKINGILSIAMANPLDLAALEFLEKKSGLKIKTAIAAAGDIQKAIEERYSQSLSTEVTAALKETGETVEKVIDISELTSGRIIREAPIAKIVATILEFAMKSRASDVHIEPQEDKTRVRYRIDGILHEKLVLPRRVHDALISRIKILCDMKIDEKRIPQDGRFNFRAGEEEVDLRVSSLPTVHGEKIVMRLLKKSGKVPTLTELGLRGAALKNLQQSILVPHGIVLITGPTGSGKTTTLYAILNEINTPRVNIVTLEDPVEYQVHGVNQVQINPQAGLTFASGLKSFLRQDPNIIMVGEIRDKETADLAIQASLTGHLVFSTLHTNSASGALPRLLDMEAEPYLLASSMTCVLAQRVVRKICENCRESYTPPPEVVANVRSVLGDLAPKDDFQIYRGQKCSACSDTGYQGRVGIFEVLPVTEKIGRLILEHKPAIDIEKMAIADGMLLMMQDGYLKALESITTVEEVIRVAQT